MSGHSKWSTIKRAKGTADAKRGQLFTKLSRDIAVAVRKGGNPDPDLNYSLRLAVDKAKGNNMPVDTIERSIAKAAGVGGSGEELEETTYEGYGPGGAAIMLQALTPNRNRTASEIRSTFTKGGGNLGETGCVGWNFDAKGVITLEVEEGQAEDIALIAIDASAEDVNIDGGFMEIFTEPEALEAVRKELETHNITSSSVEISMRPKTTVSLSVKEAEQTLKLLDNLEDLLDVQRVYSNADFPEEALQKYRGEG